MLNKIVSLTLVVCMVVILAQPVAGATEEATSKQLSAVERVANVSKQLNWQRETRGFMEMLGAGLTTVGFMSLTLLFPTKEERVFYLLIIVAPIALGILYLYDKRIKTKYYKLTLIEKDFERLSVLPITNQEKEEQAFTILKNNTEEEQKPTGAYSFYKKRHWPFPQLGPDINTGLIKLNYEEYLEQISKKE